MGSCMSCNMNSGCEQCPNEVTFPENVMRFSFKLLKKATDNFSTEFRDDGFSYSYIGTLDGSKVIVKVYNTYRDTYFASIIDIMSRIKHKNIVELIGYCFEDDHMMLVHNFLGDYSLDQFLFSDSKVENAELDWGKRVSICHGIALALDYLHNGASLCVLLRDVKPSNVFIDSSFNPKIVDLEVACFLKEGESDHIVGTVGYLDPEIWTGRYSEKTDVYAFGITVLEIISGRKNLQFLRDHSDTSLADWSWELRNSGRIPEIIDPTLSEVSEDEVMRLVYVALSCVRIPSELRRSMSEVRLMLSDGFDFRSISMMLTTPRPSLPQNVIHFSFQLLENATNNFSDRVRRNGFSSSYKGTLNDGSEVIVKVYDTNKNIDLTSMIKIMSGVRHHNVVELIGYCQEDGHQMLVHDCLGDYSLDQLLFSNSRVVVAELDWARRVFICQGIAHALDYLHTRVGTRVVLRDVTPGNIFVDGSFTPKILDFEVACLLAEGELDHRSSVVGTPGYLDPEYLMRGRFSEKTDVFSFGITLLEIISGRKNVQFVQDHGGTSLADCAWELRGSSRIREILDPSLSEFSLDEVIRFIDVALYCVQSSSELRPSMSDVRLMLSDNHDFSNMVLTGPRPTQRGSTYDEIDEILEHSPHDGE